MPQSRCADAIYLCRWVDENHALVVFAHPEAARQALGRPGKYKLRPFSKVSLLSCFPTTTIGTHA